MDRLTTRYRAQVGPANGVAVRYMALSPDTDKWIDAAVKRLAAYEDTGLMPDEIAALRALAKSDAQGRTAPLIRVRQISDEDWQNKATREAGTSTDGGGN